MGVTAEKRPETAIKPGYNGFLGFCGLIVGVPTDQVRRWERGTERPSAEHVDALAKLFGVSKGFLIGEQS